MEAHFSDCWYGRMSDVNGEGHCVQKLLRNVIQLGFPVLSAEDPWKDVKAPTRTSPAKTLRHFCQLDAGWVPDYAAVLLLVPDI